MRVFWMEVVESAADFFGLIRGDSMLAIDNSAFMLCPEGDALDWENYRMGGFIRDERFELEWLRLNALYNILVDSELWFVTRDIKREFLKGSRKLSGIIGRDGLSSRKIDYKGRLLAKRGEMSRLMHGSMAWYEMPDDEFYEYILDTFTGSCHIRNPHPDVDLIATTLSMAPSCPVDLFTHDVHLAGVFAECYENLKDSLGFGEARVLDEVERSAFSPREFLEGVVEVRRGKYSRRCD